MADKVLVFSKIGRHTSVLVFSKIGRHTSVPSKGVSQFWRKQELCHSSSDIIMAERRIRTLTQSP